jgi:hypothetical protein
LRTTRVSGTSSYPSARAGSTSRRGGGASFAKQPSPDRGPSKRNKLRSCSEPDHEGCEGDGTEVDVGAFLVAGSNGAEAFESVDGAFDCVAFLVALAVEPGGSATSRASVLPVSLLVETFGDGVSDSASSQVTAIVPGRVGLSAKTWSGRVRGRPTPVRGTETCASTRSSWGPSP